MGFKTKLKRSKRKMEEGNLIIQTETINEEILKNILNLLEKNEGSIYFYKQIKN